MRGADPADRTFTCRLRLGKGVSVDARIGVLATLRVGRLILRQLRPAARVQEMKMKGWAQLVPGSCTWSGGASCRASSCVALGSCLATSPG